METFRNQLQKRALLLASIRQYFASQNVCEVDVPVIGATAVTDPHLSSLNTQINGRQYFLQTSPEFFMKRMLSRGAGSIYSLGKAFRDDDAGIKHNPEFTMLEWYRVGYDDHHLMGDVVALIRSLEPSVEVKKISYGEIFNESVGIDPHIATVEELKTIAKTTFHIAWDDNNKSTWLDVLFTHLIEPAMSPGLTIVHDYPACQSALAKIVANESSTPVARRFEVFWSGVELANGYWELTDASEQYHRFELDNRVRKSLGLPVIEIDQHLMAALDKGLPECAGVALGVDRLMMCLMGEKDIKRVMPFSFDQL